MEWLYGRQVVVTALAAGARRRPRRLAVTPAALHALGSRVPSGLDVETVDERELEHLTRSNEHQGAAVLVGEYPYVTADVLLRTDLVVVLDEVSDPHNLGAVARSALAAGAGGLVVPRHRAAHVTPAAVKASAGTLELLRVAVVPNVTAFLKQAKKAGLWVYGAAGTATRTYTELDLRDRSVLVFGSEGRGLRPLVARACDEVAAIPLEPSVESLNVSVAAAVFLFEAKRQRAAGRPDGAE
jgi:23S rRNA (guanosine2251-2'-O)-methyltransferase